MEDLDKVIKRFEMINNIGKNCTPRLYNYVFDGLQEGGAVIVNSIRLNNDPRIRHNWYSFIIEMEKRLKPDTIIVYGKKVELTTKAKVIFIENKNFERLRTWKQRKKNG